MNPLINQFTQNLSGCSGCNSNGAVYETWLKAKQTGGKMKFQFSVVIEAGTYKEAVGKVPDEFEILQGTVKAEQKLPTAGLPTVPTNMRTGFPVNG